MVDMDNESGKSDENWEGVVVRREEMRARDYGV